MPTVTDFFCGMGGSSSGLREAGFDVKLAANHWERAIETHSANHPDTEHLCADLQTVDLRYLPRTDALWASPICTEVSPAGGRKKRRGPDLFEEHGHVPDAAFDRTRVTFWEVIRACEIHRYKLVMIENVVEAAAWELFDVWLAGMTTLGYSAQFVSVSAAHIGGEGNPYAPQWRDRIYIVFNLSGVPAPDVEPRPLAWCPRCGDVAAVQSWKMRRGLHPRRIGKYGAQYTYVCPAGHGQVEPYVAPAASAIDWTDLGQRIGDRKRPLGKATLQRVQLGLDMIGNPALIGARGNTYDRASGSGNAYLRAWPTDTSPMPTQTTDAQHAIASFVMATNHDSGRHFDPTTTPLPTRSTKNGEALVSPFVAMLRNHGGATSVTDPLATFSAGGYHHGLTVPPGAFVSQRRPNTRPRAVDEPLSTFTTDQSHGLVIPYRKGARPYPADEAPLSTMTTRDQHGVMASAVNVEDCLFRMLKPREAANAQRFPRDYIIAGNLGEQQMQAGNAVAVNVAHWLGRQVSAALGECA